MGFPVAKLLPLALNLVTGKKKDIDPKELAGEIVQSLVKSPKTTAAGSAMIGTAGTITEGSLQLPEQLVPYALAIQGVLYIGGFIVAFLDLKPKATVETVNDVPVEESKPD